MDYPAIFITGRIPKEYDRYRMLADALEAWQLRKNGVKTPKRFAFMMLCVATVWNCSPSFKTFQIIADNVFLSNWNPQALKPYEFIKPSININLN
jgi:hypothetical protein